MHKTLDTEYFFLGFGKHPSHCRIRVYEDVDAQPLPEKGEYAELDWEPQEMVNVVVVATALWGHPRQGTSIVNDAEHLATEIRDVQRARLLGRARARKPAELGTFTWIQHCPPVSGGVLSAFRKERFSLVTFTEDEQGRFRSPKWQRINRGDMEVLVGSALD